MHHQNLTVPKDSPSWVSDVTSIMTLRKQWWAVVGSGSPLCSCPLCGSKILGNIPETLPYRFLGARLLNWTLEFSCNCCYCAILPPQQFPELHDFMVRLEVEFPNFMVLWNFNLPSLCGVRCSSGVHGHYDSYEPVPSHPIHTPNLVLLLEQLQS